MNWKKKRWFNMINPSYLSLYVILDAVAIGGINGYNIPELKRCGIKYFSFISGILGSKNIPATTKQVRSVIYQKEQ